MNTEMLLRVADAIEANPQHFDLTYFFHSPKYDNFVRISEELTTGCGTTACVAGWVLHLERKDHPERFYARDMNLRGIYGESLDASAAEILDASAAEILGITPDQADRLFYANGRSVWMGQADRFGWDPDFVNWTQIKADQAATVLREIASGEIQL